MPALLTGRRPVLSHTDLGSSLASAPGKPGLGVCPVPLCPSNFSSQWGFPCSGRWAVLFRCGGPFRLGAGEPQLFHWESCSFGPVPVLFFNPHSCDTSFFWITGLLATLRSGVISLQKDAYIRVHTKICT